MELKKRTSIILGNMRKLLAKIKMVVTVYKTRDVGGRTKNINLFNGTYNAFRWFSNFSIHNY